jgi:hypothetical protein
VLVVRLPGHLLSVTALVALAAMLTGCSGGRLETDHVRDVAQQLARAAGSGDGSAICALLTPAAVEEVQSSEGKPCPDAITSVDLKPSSSVDAAEVYGRTAKVTYDDSVAFLSLFHGDWRIYAAGCTPRPQRPYDCTLQAG